MMKLVNFCQFVSTSPCRLSIACLILIGLVYLPVVFTEYGFYDDYYHLAMVQEGQPYSELFKIGTRQGRPLAGLAFAVSSISTTDVSSLVYLRAVGIAFTASFGFACFYMLIRSGFSKELSFLGASLVSLLPTFQVFVSWTICFIFPLGVLLGLFSGYCWVQFWNNRKQVGSRSGIKWFAMSALSIALAMAIYQPAAMMVWCFPAIYVLSRQKSFISELRFLVPTGVFVACSMVFGFVLLKVGVYLYGAHGGERSGLVDDVPGKILWFLKEPLPGFVVPWSLENHMWLTVVSALLIVVGFYAFYKKSIMVALRKLCWVLIFIVLAYLPNLLTQENWASFRTQIAVGSLVTISVVLALIGWRKLIGLSYSHSIIVSGCLLLVIASTAQHNVVRGFAIPQTKEWSWLKAQVRLIDTGFDSNKVVVIGSDWTHSIASKVYFDEFGFPSSGQHWMPVPMVRLAMTVVGLNPSDYEIVRVEPELWADAEKGADTLIDFRRIKYLR